jgi:hypothetical protein
MAGNEDHSPMSMEEAIAASENSMEVQESTEQQASENQEQSESNETEAGTQQTSGETQEERSDEVSTDKEGQEEAEVATEEQDIIDIVSEEESSAQENTVETETQENSLNFSEILNGEFSDENDLASYIDELHSRLDEAESKEPKFANDYVKRMNDHVLAGNKASDFARVQGLDLENMSPVEKLTTHLKMNNPNLTDQQAKEYILNKYDLDDEDNGSDNTRAIIDSNAAHSEIKKIQADDTPAAKPGMSEDEWNEKLDQFNSERNEALMKEDEARMGEWEKPIENSVENLKKNGIVVDLGNGKGYRYAFDGDQKYVENLVTQVEEALFMSGTSVKESPDLAKQMIEIQYKADNFDKIVKAAMVKGSNSTNEKWFKEVHNPSPISRGDTAQQESTELPSAEEAMNNIWNQ